MPQPEKGLVGYLLYGTEGEPRDSKNIAYYHRADKLRAAAEAEGYNSLVVYSRRSSRNRSGLQRMLRSSWLKEKFRDCRAVYAAAEPAGMASWALRKTAIPVIYDVHTPPVGEKWLQFLLNKSARNFAIFIEASIAEYIAIRYSDTILWCSSLQRDYYLRRGYPASRLREVRHGVDLQKFDMGAPKNNEAPLLCYAGTMVNYQGADRLVEAYEMLGRAALRLRMIGFTPADSQLESRARAAGVDCFPQLPHDELLNKLRDCDCTAIVAHPDAVKYKNEAAPTKWPESLALGRPVISGDAYDTAELIRQLRVGWVVDNSPEGLLKGMRALSETPREELAQMGLRARAEAERNYGWETIGRNFVEAIEQSSKR